MKLRDINWPTLHLPMLAMAVALSASAAAVYFTEQKRAATERVLNGERATLSAIRQRVSQSDQEKQVILRYLQTYEDLRNQGVVGPEQRVNWLDALRAASQQVRVFELDYQLGQQGRSTLPIDSTAYNLQQSVMKLRMRLLHEGDVLGLLNALEDQHAGLYLLNRCSVSRIAGNRAALRYEPHIEADCELTWLSLTPKEKG